MTAASVDFIDNGGIWITQFVASRFLGRIGCFQEAFLDPTLAQQRRGPRLVAEYVGNILGCNLSRLPEQSQGSALLGVQVAQQLGLILAAFFGLAQGLIAYLLEG